MKGKLFVWLISCLAFLLFPGGAQAEERYPGRPIELVVPMGPGGAGDLSTRCYSEELARELKVPVNVVNRAGGTGIQGTNYVIMARKDGYTLLASHAAPIVTLPIIKKDVPYNPLKDLIPLGQFVHVPSIIAVRNDSPLKTLKELVYYAKKNPGKLKTGVGGIGTESDFNKMILCARNDIKITSVPFQSGAESVTALLGGHVDMAVNTITTLAPHLKAGKLRGLSISSKTRSPDFPDIPTTAEDGYPYVNFIGWFGFFAATGVPRPVLDVLGPTLQKVFQNREVGERARKLGFTLDYKNPEEFRKLLEEKTEIARKVALDANLIMK